VFCSPVQHCAGPSPYRSRVGAAKVPGETPSREKGREEHFLKRPCSQTPVQETGINYDAENYEKEDSYLKPERQRFVPFL
jgi:hypothetical protein